MSRFWCVGLLVLAGCGSSPTAPSAHVTGHLDLASFTTGTPTGFEAIGDDGDVRSGTLAPDGSFDVRLALEDTYVFRVALENGGPVPVALPRTGHFDRGLITGGRVEARLGTVWLPPPSNDVARVNESEAATCSDGHLASGQPCAVLEALVSCADGPARPLDDPTDLLLGTGRLADLPGPGPFAVPSQVPPPILWECSPLQAQ